LGALSEGRNTNFSKLLERPQTPNSYLGQAETIAGATDIIFWGCPGMNFSVSLPFHGMRQDFAAF